MQYDPLLIAGTAVSILLGGIIQGAIGFAYALFVTPIMVWMGIPLPDTVVIVATCSFIQASLGLRHLRTALPWREAGWAIAGRLPTMVVGVILLKTISVLNPETIKMIVGLTICLVVVIQVAFRVKPVERVHIAWSAAALLSSGFLTGLIGMGGAPLVMWVMAHNWSNEKTRSLLFAVIVVTFPILIGQLFVTFGAVILKGVLVGILLTPVVYLGSRVGMPLGNRMPKPMMRNIAYLVLVIIGLSAVIPQLLRMIFS
jgi:hypothetical protein